MHKVPKLRLYNRVDMLVFLYLIALGIIQKVNVKKVLLKKFFKIPLVLNELSGNDYRVATLPKSYLLNISKCKV